MKIDKVLKLLRFGAKALPSIQGSFSQFGEDFFLRWQFPQKRDGFYVDAGAFDPFYFSNTHYFYAAGWNGINIEPNPAQFTNFTKHRPRDINLNLAVSDKEGTVDFLPAGLCAGIVDENYNNLDRSGTLIRVPCRRLDRILAEYLPPGRRIDFMSIDCEGHDLRVVDSNDWTRFRPEVLVIEDQVQKADTEVVRKAESLGYELASWYRLTKFFVDRSPV